jgi:bifunctional non-homologous end joining protein LigD
MPGPRKPRAAALETYRARRSASATPEPFGGEPAGPEDDAELVFVVQKHAARRLHYDLRLELDGVLLSWALPKEPSYDQRDKRLAVQTEDHPLEYADFEGVIPKGNYGAGAMIVWDRGRWTPIGDPHEGLRQGKLLFDLHGHKLRGRWTLVKIRKSEREWLLIKERDGRQTPTPEPLPQGSVLSGLTVEALRDGVRPADALAQELAKLGAPRRRLSARDVQPMLAERSEQPFSRPDWLFEIKYDGYRIIAGAEQGAPLLLTRNGNDLTASFPEIAEAVAALPCGRVVLDGEVVAHDEAGRPSFQLLQNRARVRSGSTARRAAARAPVVYYAFDLLGLEEHDLRPLPLHARKELLRRLLPEAGTLRYCDHVAERGVEFFAAARQLDLEGMIAKRADSPYRAGRSDDWVKVRADHVEDFVVVGYTRKARARSGFDSLHLARATDAGALEYIGSVGTGFTGDQQREYGRLLESLRVAEPMAAGAPAGREQHWVEPVVVVEVRYLEVTRDGLLRHPVLLRFRDDLSGSTPPPPAADAAPRTRGSGAPRRPPTATPTAAAAADRTVRLSNLDKTFWPEDGLTKGDHIAYYQTIAPWLLPYLRDRPLVMTRYPDGIHGKSFFQKDAPPGAPAWLRTVRVWSEESERELSYIVADDAAALTWVANAASIPLHVWASRVASLERPDWASLDLDPKEAPFSDVIAVAQVAQALCADIELPAFIKTSGSTGLHVLVPVARRFTHGEARSLAELLARAIVREVPEVATLERQVRRRAGKVYVDYLQNGQGKLLVAPFSVRPLPGAPVSTPLHWDEVKPGLSIAQHTISTVPERMARLGTDPLAAVLDTDVDLAAVLNRLQERWTLT